MAQEAKHPTIVIGAGPTGLAAAAQLAVRNLDFILLEAGDTVGYSVHQWRHVRVFSPWRYNIDKQARALLDQTAWTSPNDDDLPTGAQLIESYLQPLAAHPLIASRIRLNARVVSIGRKNFDKVRTEGRFEQPFEIGLESGELLHASAVIDASGTWFTPNPIGSGGRSVPGEIEARAHIAYGIPDVTGSSRARYAGKSVLVVGAGHSATNVVLDLIQLKRDEPNTTIQWVMRRENLGSVFGGEGADALPARGALGSSARAALASGEVDLITPYRIEAVSQVDGRLQISGELKLSEGDRRTHIVEADEIIVAAGFRPDLDPLRELRLKLDPWLESAEALGPLIDPNVHSCGTVRPHTYEELAHPERDFFIIGSKSYGRAPTFLMATGYEQARSVVAALAGDLEAASRVELQLPQTGVCGTGDKASASDRLQIPASDGCCGGPPPEGVDACCVKDADAKANGLEGCGCGSASASEPQPLAAAAAQCC